MIDEKIRGIETTTEGAVGVKTILLDIETTPLVTYTWGLYDESISPYNIIRDRSVLCIAWKELGKPVVHGASVGPDMTERDVLAVFRAAVDDADILVGHNLARFDLKHLNAKFIEYGLAPLQKHNIVDTLVEVRKIAKFASNRLDWLGHKLLGYGKVDTGGMSLWKACMAGDEKSLAKMLRYCKNDVKLLEDLYVKLRPYFKTHPNVADYDSLNCPRCNSASVRLRKEYRTKAGLLRNHMQCNACHAPFTMRGTSKSPRPLSVA